MPILYDGDLREVRCAKSVVQIVLWYGMVWGWGMGYGVDLVKSGMYLTIT